MDVLNFMITGVVRESQTNHVMRISRIAICEDKHKAMYAFRHHARNYGLEVLTQEANEIKALEYKAFGKQLMHIYDKGQHLDNHKRA